MLLILLYEFYYCEVTHYLLFNFIIVNNCAVNRIALVMCLAVIVKQSMLIAVIVALFVAVGVFIFTQAHEGNKLYREIIIASIKLLFCFTDLCDSEWIYLRNVMIASTLVLNLYLMVVFAVLSLILFCIKGTYNA